MISSHRLSSAPTEDTKGKYMLYEGDDDPIHSADRGWWSSHHSGIPYVSDFKQSQKFSMETIKLVMFHFYLLSYVLMC